MKQSGNNEIDLLLRRLARREGAKSVLREGAAEDQSPSMHLDADELNSYAEQALPAATRARYTTHLADCSRCRQIVSELTSAAGTRVRKPLVEQKPSGAFWQKVGALLSPAVLRFAVPALALFAVIAVGLVALKQQQQSDFVAQNQPSASGGTASELKQTDSPAVNNSAAISQDSRSNESQTRAGTLRDKQAKTSEPSEVAKTSDRATDSVSVVSEKDASKGKVGGVVAQPTFAPEPAAPTPKAEVSTPASQNDADARQNEEAARRDASTREQEGARARTEDSQNQVAVSKARNIPPAARSPEGLRTMGPGHGSVAGGKKSDDEVKTRSVSGRRFRREGSVWVDTSYQSSTATTNLARGSEQYRALVADEPGIRAIAEQLQGEVVLIWKGRAYRIR